MNITLTFFEPIRMMEWIDPKDRRSTTSKYIRAQSFARWHKCETNKKMGTPFITGTLLRSAVIRAAEHFLVLESGLIDGTPCCPGQFARPEAHKENIMHLRQRTTPVWTKAPLCDDNHLCPFCELLGRKTAHKNAIKSDKNTDKNQFNIQFKNLSLPGKKKYYPETVATERTLNRVDFVTGKAHDFFKIFEIDLQQFPVFEGKIIIADYVSPATASLLRKSLMFIDRLCGALCAITFDVNNVAPIDLLNEQFSVSIEKIADNIIEILEINSATSFLRVLSDTVRELSRDKERIFHLPKDHNNEKNHHIWDLKDNNFSIRSLLLNTVEKIDDNQFTRFFKSLGAVLYRREKELSRGLQNSKHIRGEKKSSDILKKSRRILGDRAYYGKNPFKDQPPDVQIVPDREFLFYGKLISETPFFFGLENEQKQQTDFTILLDRHNHYRLPRSALRGILRRDLRMVIGGSGCDVRLGGYQCLCPICQLMRNITIMDVRSQNPENPEVRQRIRLNPYTGTVSEGALFSMELGPQGLEFPFVLRYRGYNTNLPDDLIKVLTNWTKGQAFLSGASSTGKGRFRLCDLKQKEFDLSDITYLAQRGWRNREKDIPDMKGFTGKKKADSFWKKVLIEIHVKSPLLNGDPVRALLDENGSDIVSFKKYQTASDSQQVYAFKSESLKGIFRTALGRRFHHQDSIEQKELPLLALSHKDCECPLCRLFGSEYESGKIKFEDLIFEEEPQTKKFDHVAIDRFTGGAVDKKKFDDLSLPGSPQKPLILKGNLWIRHDLSTYDYNYLNMAFLDIKKGLYSLGAKTGSGYGQIQDIKLNPENAFNSKPTDRFYHQSNHAFQKNEPSVKKETKTQISIHTDAVYFPHYFLTPHQQVHRKTIPMDHLSIHHDNCYTGKITCTLTTKTPLIIPDTENDDAFYLKNKIKNEDGRYHKSHAFFSINGEYMIPGSEIRGMISSVYEALTNSCFRIFDEKNRLSWRMEADKKNLENFVPGRIIKEGKHFFVKQMDEVRYPYYDKDCRNDSEQKKHFPLDKYEDVFYKHPTSTDKRLMTLAKFNRDNAHKNLRYKYKIINHRRGAKEKESFMFVATPSDNPKRFYQDQIFENNAIGFLKVSGPNKIEKEKDSHRELESKLPDNPDKVVHTGVSPQTIKVPCGNFQNEECERIRLVPEFVYKDEKTGLTYTMNKRCERVFLENNRYSKIKLSTEAIEKFEILVKEYKNNATQQETPKVFQTILPENGTINEGDLIYFRKEDDKAVEIIPVRISRKVDSKYIGKRLAKQLRPCHGEWLEPDDLSTIDPYPEKKLFTRNPEGLCPACQLFGTGAYKGKLRFGFASLNNDPVWLNPGDHSQILPLLERPRPTWAIPDATVTSEVPGRKFYIHHQAWKQIQRKENPSTGKKIEYSVNNRTVQPLDINNSFTFDIHFENLEAHELGLLFYILQLEEGLSHKLGMAKPFGFGSIDINIQELLFLNPGDHQWINKTTQTEQFIDKGKEHLEELFENNWDDIDHINDLKSFLYFNDNDNISVYYPLLRRKDYPDKNLPGYEEIKDNFQKGIQIRQYLLTSPWAPWANKEKKTLPDAIVYPVSQIDIQNYFQIKSAKIEIPEEAQWLFLTGNNSFGKTTLLQAIATGLSGDDPRIKQFNTDCNIRIKITNNWTNDLKNRPFKPYTNFVAYGPSRLNISTGHAQETKSYHSLFNTDGVYYHNIEDKLILWRERDLARFNLIRSILIDLLPTIEEIYFHEQEDLTDPEVRYKDGLANLSFSELGTGNRSIIAMIGDMIVRFSKNQKNIKDKKDFTGLVIIDELDLHLHPYWQKKLPSLLSQAFPKVRFIVSTHSAIPFLGAPKNSAFFKVSREDGNNNIIVDRIDIDITNLLPNAILTSPLFDMDNIHQDNLEKYADMRTENYYSEIQRNDEIKKKYQKFLESDTEDLTDDLFS